MSHARTHVLVHTKVAATLVRNFEISLRLGIYVNCQWLVLSLVARP